MERIEDLDAFAGAWVFSCLMSAIALLRILIPEIIALWDNVHERRRQNIVG